MSNTENRKLRNKIKRLERNIEDYRILTQHNTELREFFDRQSDRLRDRFWDSSPIKGMIDALHQFAEYPHRGIGRITNHIHYYLNHTQVKTDNLKVLDEKVLDVVKWIANDYTTLLTQSTFQMFSNKATELVTETLKDLGLNPGVYGMPNILADIIQCGLNMSLKAQFKSPCKLTSDSGNYRFELRAEFDVISLLNSVVLFTPMDSINDRIAEWTFHPEDIFKLFSTLTKETPDLNVLAMFIYHIWSRLPLTQGLIRLGIIN